MDIVKPRTLSGFMELLPEKQLQFDAIADTLREVYKSYGFYPLDTPILEASEILLAKGCGDTELHIYRFTKGDTDLSMRFDLTVPLAKYVALNYGALTFPFRRFQIGKVYRGERAQRGRFREFYQADIDIIGDGELSVINEAEIPAIIYRTFAELGLTRFVIRINNRKLLSGFFDMLGCDIAASDIMRVIDKLDKIGLEKVMEELASLGMGDEGRRLVGGFISQTGSPAQILESLKEYAGRSELFDKGYEELQTVVKYVFAFGVPETNFAIDLTIARGLDYYTGTVYETIMTDHPEIGSICSGGRYDNLAEYYTSKKLPGVGISIGLTRLFFILDDMNYISGEGSPANVDVLVLPMTDDISASIEFSQMLREQGVKTQIYYENKKFKAKIGYADKVSAPYAAIIGEDELAEGKVTVKDMKAGTQQTVPCEEAVGIISQALAARTPHKIIEVKREEV